MIKKEDVKDIAIKFLDSNNIKYENISEKIFFEINEIIVYGKVKGEKRDIFLLSFGQLWGMQERSMFLCIDAETGEVLYVLGPHGPIYVVE